jgi:FdhE protein
MATLVVALPLFKRKIPLFLISEVQKMSQQNVVSKEYQELQEQLNSWHKKWSDKLSAEELIKSSDNLRADQPILSQIKVEVKEETLVEMYSDLINFLNELIPDLKSSLVKVENMNSEELNKWFIESLKSNNLYFEKFAEENELEEWIPQFIAEHLIRPFLHVMSKQFEEKLEDINNGIGCKFCGEPIRLAKQGENGKKVIVCPRCEAAWAQKKLECAICGSDDHKDITILKIDDDTTGQIQACKKCKGYLKFVEARKLFRNHTPEIVDLLTIHFDYIAQEHGYGESEGTTN